MRVAFFSPSFFPENDADAVRVHEHARLLVERGHEVHVITGPSRPDRTLGPFAGTRYERDRVDGVTVHRCPALRSSPPQRLVGGLHPLVNPVLLAALGTVRVPSVDAVLVSAHEVGVGLAGLAFARLRGLPLFVELRGGLPRLHEAPRGQADAHRSERPRVVAWLFEQLLRGARGVIVTSREDLPEVARHGVPIDRVTVVEDGVDLRRFGAAGKAAPLRRELGIPDHALVCLTCEPMDLRHDLGFVPRAAAHRPPDLDLHFVLVGGGPLRRQLASAIEGLNVTDRVHLCPPVSHRSVPQLLLGADLALVLPASDARAMTATSLPAAMLEAMAMERPVLLGAHGPAADVLERADAGLAFAPGDVPTFWEHVRDLVSLGPSGRATLGRAGRAHVAGHHDRRVLVGELERFVSALR